jgi:hypothetical protein
VLITGGAKGIGRMISEGYVANGAKVYISSRDAKASAKACEELNKLGKHSHSLWSCCISRYSCSNNYKVRVVPMPFPPISTNSKTAKGLPMNLQRKRTTSTFSLTTPVQIGELRTASTQMPPGHES